MQPEPSSWKMAIWRPWRPRALERPQLGQDLSQLTRIQRSAEIIKYSVLRAEYWMSPEGSLREWLRLNVNLAVLLCIPALFIVPVVTYLFHQFATWTELLVQIAKNLVVFPIAGTALMTVITGVLLILRLLIRR